jgi:hypothetical protein
MYRLGTKQCGYNRLLRLTARQTSPKSRVGMSFIPITGMRLAAPVSNPSSVGTGIATPAGAIRLSALYATAATNATTNAFRIFPK